MSLITKKLDLFIILIFPLLIFTLVFLSNSRITYLESLLLIFVIPCIYLSWRSRKKIRRVLGFSFLVSIPVALTIELIAYWDQAWSVPQSAFDFRVFNLFPIEDFLWQFLTVYTILIFYEHFCRNKSMGVLPKKFIILSLGLYILCGIVIALFIFESPLLHITYPYLWFGILFFVIPVIIFLRKYPDYFIPFLKVQLFFLYIHTLFELIGVKLGHWIYPSPHYFGWMTLVGQRFPLEEFIFVMLLGAFAACAYYEYFTNEHLTTRRS